MTRPRSLLRTAYMATAEMPSATMSTTMCCVGQQRGEGKWEDVGSRRTWEAGGRGKQEIVAWEGGGMKGTSTNSTFAQS